MKIIFRSAALAALIITTSCGKDTVETIVDEIDEQTEQLEQTPLEANTVADNVVIAGGTKEEGVPPTPNGAISLDVSNAEKTAFLNEGFNVPVSSDGDIVGAYLQFKANDGTVSDSYYDIEVSSNTFSKKALRKTIFNKKAFTKTAKVDEANFDVDFNTQIEPGTFCYVICVYDGNGNISNPSEVCVTVESWGGSNAVVGKWALVKEETIEDGETSVYDLGQPDCDEWTATCNNQEEIDFSICYTQEYGILEIKADGTYGIDFKGTDENYDYDASIETCETVYTADTTFRYQSKGNWAYVANEDRLTLVEYEYTFEEDGETESETVENGEADLVYDGKVTVNGNSFVLIEVADYDGDGASDGTYKYYFEK